MTARKASSLSGFGARPRQQSAAPGLRALDATAIDPAQWGEARVLVLSPHPDDELIGCGGTLCRLLAAGAKVSIVQATDGSRLESLHGLEEPVRKTLRLEEARRVAFALGARLILWREQDASLECSEHAVRRLAALLDEICPTHVFTPFVGDRHGDHRALSAILAEALAQARCEPEVLQYEVWGVVPANRYCDVSQESQAVERLLHLYRSAMQVEDFVHFCERRNLARALELTGRPGYIEAFHACTGEDYGRLAAGMTTQRSAPGFVAVARQRLATNLLAARARKRFARRPEETLGTRRVPADRAKENGTGIARTPPPSLKPPRGGRDAQRIE